MRDTTTEMAMQHRRLTPMMLFVALSLLTLTIAPSGAVSANDGKKQAPASRVDVTVELPTTLPGFDDAALVAILYEFDPRIADKAADEVDRVVVRHLGHQQGIEQTLRFTIGDAINNPRPDRRYYVSCRVYEDLGDKDAFKRGKQLHYCHNEHPQAPGRVYDETNGTSLTFVAR